MAFRVRFTARLSWLQLVSVSVCLCVFTFLPVYHHDLVKCVEAAKGECPCHEQDESSEKELVVCSSTRHRLNSRARGDISRPRETHLRLHQDASCTGRRPAIVGHQFANGLCAPLQI